MDHRFSIVSIDMQYGGKGHFGYICTIGTGARVEVIGRKSNLVVDYDVNGSSCGIPF